MRRMMSKCPELTKKALEAGADPQELLEKHLLVWTKDITGRSIFDSCREVDGTAPVKGRKCSDALRTGGNC